MYFQRQNSYAYVDYDGPMLGPVDDDFQPPEADPNAPNEYDRECNRMLEEAEELLLSGKSTTPTKKVESHEDVDHVGSDFWYKDMCKKKVKAARDRLEDLSKLACYTSLSVESHIKRVKEDHGTTFCKMDSNPRHPPLHMPSTNTWKFNCTIKCKETGKPNHTHTAYCESIVLQHFEPNISQDDYPHYVKDAVQLFEDFAAVTISNMPYSGTKEEQNNNAYQKTMWSGIKLYVRSNCNKEVMMIVRGKKITPLVGKLKRYFQSGPERYTNVISVFCMDQTWRPNKSNYDSANITGLFKLKDNLGPISIEYKPKTNVDFNAVEAVELAKIVQEYAGLNNETTLLDIGCNFGVLSLMMSRECETVIGINTMHSLNNEMNQAEELKKFNKIENVSFLACQPEDLLTKCSPFVKQCITVAVLNLSSPYGKSNHVMQALRDLPSIWRVIIYGTFTKEFHKHINMLMIESNSMGEHYLPMQGCILDKSPSAENGFDIVIMFERLSLITPKIKVLESGLTLNLKQDFSTYEYDSTNAEELKPKFQINSYQESKNGKLYEEKSILSNRNRSSTVSSNEKSFDSSTFKSHEKYSRHRRDSSTKEAKSRSSSRSQPSSSSNKEKPFDCSLLKRERFDSLALATDRQYSHHRRDFVQREERSSPDELPSTLNKGLYDCPTSSRGQSSSSSSKEKSFDSSLLQRERFDSSSLATDRQYSHHRRDSQSSSSSSKGNSDSSSLKRERLDSSTDRQYSHHREDSVQRENRSNSERLSSVLNNDSYDCPTPKYEEFDISTLGELETSTHQNEDQNPFSQNVSLSVRKEFQCRYPSPPKERFPSPPPPPPFSPPPLETNLPIKAEPLQVNDNQRDDRSKSANDGIFKIPIKLEPTNTTNIASNSKNNSSNVSPPSKIKCEPTDFQQNSSELSNVKQEAEASTIPSNYQDIENMETPIHNPRALNGIPVPAASTDVPVNGFAVQANLSYLNLIDWSKIEKDKDAGDSPSTIVQTDVSQIEKEKDSSEPLLSVVNTENREIPRVTIKSEVIDPSYSSSFSEISYEDIPQPIKIKSEPIDSQEMSFQPVNVKTEPVDSQEMSCPAATDDTEPMDMEISPQSQPIESMQTPLHDSRAFNGTHVSPPSVESFTTINGIEVPIQANKSYLTIKSEPEQPKIKEEPIVQEEEEEEITIVDEKIIQLKDSPKIRIKSEVDITEVKSEPKENEELDRLFKQRQAILRQLNRERDEKRVHQRQLSPSPPSKKQKRSSSPRRYSRSPSSSYNRSNSPYSRSRSPSYKRSAKRSKRSRSPSVRRHRRSPPSPDRSERGGRRSPFDKRDVYGRIKSPTNRSCWDQRDRSRSPKRR